MAKVHKPDAEWTVGSTAAPDVRFLSAVVAGPALSAAVVITAAATDAPLGAPPYWPWLLTGLQVLALWSAGGGRWWGWLLGATVQLPWIAYALVTGQLGFIPGCAVSAVVQAHSFLAVGPDPGDAGAGDSRDAHPCAGRRR
jgi:hypothetical protein